MSVNKVILTGFCSGSPVSKEYERYGNFTTFKIRTKDSWVEKNKVRKEKFIHHQVIVNNLKMIEMVNKYVKEGRELYVEGSLSEFYWMDGKGVERSKSVIMLTTFEVFGISQYKSLAEDPNDNKDYVWAEPK